MAKSKVTTSGKARRRTPDDDDNAGQSNRAPKRSREQEAELVVSSGPAPGSSDDDERTEYSEFQHQDERGGNVEDYSEDGNVVHTSSQRSVEGVENVAGGQQQPPAVIPPPPVQVIPRIPNLGYIIPPRSDHSLRAQQIRALNALHFCEDLPTMCTSFRLVKELGAEDGPLPPEQLPPYGHVGGGNDDGGGNVGEVRTLMSQASIAVPYLLKKTLTKLLAKAEPDGPALDVAAARDLAVFLTGPSVGMEQCTDGTFVTEEDLIQGGLRPIRARRVLPFLKAMGRDNEIQSQAVRREVMEGVPANPQPRAVGQQGHGSEQGGGQQQRAGEASIGFQR